MVSPRVSHTQRGGSLLDQWIQPHRCPTTRTTTATTSTATNPTHHRSNIILHAAYRFIPISLPIDQHFIGSGATIKVHRHKHRKHKKARVLAAPGIAMCTISSHITSPISSRRRSRTEARTARWHHAASERNGTRGWRDKSIHVHLRSDRS
jgi:hypothetical protein